MTTGRAVATLHLVAAMVAGCTAVGVAGLSAASAVGYPTSWWSMVAGLAMFPIVVTTGTSGQLASRAHPTAPAVRAKRARMPWIGGPTLFGLVPLGVAAEWLAHAHPSTLVPAVHAVRALIALAVLAAMGRSIRDGRSLSVPKRRARRRRAG
ncbi:MAG: hypothetical protein R3F59_05030 [Myxococcota bacterium]